VAEAWQEEVMWNGRGTEPSLDELFRDVAMQLLMARDGVRESDIRALLSELRNAREAASGETARERDDSVFANKASDRGQNMVSSGLKEPPNPGKLPIRFI
jgi:hypothetical protein